MPGIGRRTAAAASPLLIALPLLLAAPPAVTRAGAQDAPSVAEPQAPQPSLADSVRPYLVFVPTGESWFVVASRAKRMLLDIGRVDLEVRRDSALAQAYREVAAARSPVPVGTEFTLRAPWGAERVRATGVDTWNGRIVLLLAGSARLDSAAQERTPVTATAHRAVTGRPLPVPRTPTPAARTAGAAVLPPPVMPGNVTTPACDRAPAEGAYAARVDAVRDSLEAVLRAEGLPIYERLARRVTAASSRIPGCFGEARMMLAVSLRAAANEWTRERIVLVHPDGRVQPLRVQDLRFRVHDLLHALDGDGDGVDDVAAVGRAHLAGGTTVLRYDPKEQRLVRIAAGFSWEDR